MRHFKVALAILAFAVTVGAQQAEDLSRKVIAVSDEKEPQWKLFRNLQIPNEDADAPQMAWLQWESGKDRVDADIIILPNAKLASKWMRLFKHRSLQHGTINSLGQTNFIEYNGDAGVYIMCQRRRILFGVSAPSKDVALRFARLIAALAT